MTLSGRDLKQIQLLSRVQTLRTEKIKQQIAQVCEAIKLKETTIQQFEQYAKTYGETPRAMLLDIRVLKNNEAFHHNLMLVINTEKKDLNRLTAMQKQLMSSYLQSVNRNDGINRLHTELRNEKMEHHARVNEEEMNDLSNTLKGLKNKWNP